VVFTDPGAVAGSESGVAFASWLAAAPDADTLAMVLSQDEADVWWMVGKGDRYWTSATYDVWTRW
jgi:hypothetical protein